MTLISILNIRNKSFVLSILIIIILGFLFIFNNNSVFAENKVGFSVKPVIKKEQLKGKNSFFNLRVAPNTKYSLQVQIDNFSDKQINVVASAHNALTDNQGHINYKNDAKTNLDSSMKTPFISLITNETKRKIVIPAKNSVTTDFVIKTPASIFSGIILGGLSFTDDANAQNSNSGQVSLSNSYSYLLPVAINEGKVVNPDLKLTRAGSKIIDNNNNFYANYRNDQPYLMTNVKMINEVYSEDGYYKHREPLYSSSKDNTSIAPNTNFDYLVSSNNQAIKSGKYVFVSNVEWHGKKKKYIKPFKVSFAQSYSNNKKAIGVKSEYTWLYLLVGAAFIIIILLITVILLLIKNRKK